MRGPRAATPYGGSLALQLGRGFIMNDSNARAKTTKLRLSTQKMRDLTPQTTSESPGLVIDPLGKAPSNGDPKTNEFPSA